MTEFDQKFLESYETLVTYAKSVNFSDGELGRDLVHSAYLKYSATGIYGEGFVRVMKGIIWQMSWNGHLSDKGRFKTGPKKYKVNEFIPIESLFKLCDKSDLEEAYSVKERSDFLSSFMRTLPTGQERVFRYVLSGGSIQEYALETGKTFESVKRSYRESYLKAREYFKQESA